MSKDIPQKLPEEIMELAEEFDSARKQGDIVQFVLDRINYGQQAFAAVDNILTGDFKSVLIEDKTETTKD